jgi:glucose-6-phosphate isomerase
MSEQPTWKQFQEQLYRCESIGLSVDWSRMGMDSTFLEKMAPRFESARMAMEALEDGAIANPDENRMVGHYWLRDPGRAPDALLTEQILSMQERIKAFASDVHEGRVTPKTADRFTDVLVIGIGGSTLGPQFVADALGDPASDRMAIHFFDNTDPDGIDRTLRGLGDRLASTLSIVISKSGGTPETRNGMLLAQSAYEAAGLSFANYAVAVTGEGSKLDTIAQSDEWLLRLPMWDWVGGRTSELAAVGLLPAALQGIDIDALLAGAAAADEATRSQSMETNPAAIMAVAWYHATNGRGEKDMVVLPYKDRLLLFSRYLQQLVMESLGKADDLDGTRVEQGIAVYGNKGSTDQHAYVQQLREGVNNFFVTFVVCLADGGSDMEVSEGATAGDYLYGFWLGTRQALFENGRASMTLMVDRIDAHCVGALISLFERAVGYYASFVNINAYHQPGVEAGKKAAASVLSLQERVVAQLGKTPQTAEQLAESVGAAGETETAWHLLHHLAANGRIGEDPSGFTQL